MSTTTKASFVEEVATPLYDTQTYSNGKCVFFTDANFKGFDRTNVRSSGLSAENRFKAAGIRFRFGKTNYTDSLFEIRATFVVCDRVMWESPLALLPILDNSSMLLIGGSLGSLPVPMPPFMPFSVSLCGPVLDRDCPVWCQLEGIRHRPVI